MENWREKALDDFPEHEEEIREVDSPMGLWIILWCAFVAAYEQDPIDHGTVDRIYSFAEWCSAQPQVDDASLDLPTCAACGFYEHVPTIVQARAEIHLRFSRDHVELMRGVFGYFLGPDEWQALMKTYDAAQSKREIRKAQRD
jgi:hypothetical protein